MLGQESFLSKCWHDCFKSCTEGCAIVATKHVVLKNHGVCLKIHCQHQKHYSTPKKKCILCVYIYIKLKTKDLLPCGNQTWPWKITDSYMMFPWTAHQVKGMESRAPAGCEVGWATKGACYDRLVGPPALASTWKKSKKQGCCVTKMMCSHRFCHILPYGWSGSNKERLIKPQIQKIWGCYNQGPSGSFRAFRLDATKQKWDQTWNCPRWNTTGNRVKAGKGR